MSLQSQKSKGSYAANFRLYNFKLSTYKIGGLK